MIFQVVTGTNLSFGSIDPARIKNIRSEVELGCPAAHSRGGQRALVDATTMGASGTACASGSKTGAVGKACDLGRSRL